MRRVLDIVNALQPVHGVILLVVAAVGVFGTFAIGNQIEKGAIESWVRQAELDVSVATTTAQSWLAQSETIISGLALGFADPAEVTTEAFEDLVFQAEDWNSEFALDAVAIVQRVPRPQRGEMERVLGQPLADANDPATTVPDAFMHMVVVKSTESLGSLRPSVDLLTMQEMGIVATTAQQVPDKAILGPAFVASDGRLFSLVGIGLPDSDRNAVLVGRVDLSELIEILLSSYVPEGLVLRISERDNEARADTLLRPIYGPLEAGDETVHTVTIRVTRGQARWNYNWDVTSGYLGGAPTANATMVEIGGLIITILVVYTIGLLSLQNALIKAQVEEQTKELTEAKAMLLRSHDQLEVLVAERTAALQESEARYREIFEESPVGIWTEDWSQVKQAIARVMQNGALDLASHLETHPEFLIELYALRRRKVEISQATLALYHASSKQALLDNDRGELVTAAELSSFRETLLSFQSGQWSRDDEGPYRRTDGAVMYLDSRLVVPPRHRDEWSRVIYAMEDITEQKRAEEQLRQAQKMEAVGQLTGGVAHDFNNLLGIIMGNADLLTFKVGQGDPEVQAVIRAATRGADLTGRLLAFSRKQTLLPRAIEVKTLIDGMIALLGRSLGETIEIKTSFPPGLWFAKVDPGQLESALLNLAINARDAMPEGGALVIDAANANLDAAFARNHPDVMPGDYVMLSVADSGSGMSAEVLEHALEPFFTTKEVGAGSGLGLSMVYGFAKQSDGHVAISSEPGLGTTVKLYLPRSTEDAVRVSEETAKEIPSAQGETILVVEDDPDLRKFTVAMLENLGYRVLQAPDGWAALALLEESEPPDLLLSDVVLPRRLSGPDLAAKVTGVHASVKVLFMSGYTEYAADHNDLVEDGAELLKKPFRIHELALKLRSLLDR